MVKVHLSEELVDSSGNVWGAGRESLTRRGHKAADERCITAKAWQSAPSFGLRQQYALNCLRRLQPCICSRNRIWTMKESFQKSDLESLHPSTDCSSIFPVSQASESTTGRV